LARSIRGFLKAVSQQEIFDGGSADGSFAKLVFHCIDGSGHAAVTVTLAEFAYLNAHPAVMNRVELAMRFEAYALDEFCNELESIARRKSKRARRITSAGL
jgi:hypothetical protein